MSVSSPEISLSSSSTSSKEDVDYWEINPQPPPSQVSRLSSMDCWDYSIELECLKGPEGFYFYFHFISLYRMLMAVFRTVYFHHLCLSISNELKVISPNWKVLRASMIILNVNFSIDERESRDKVCFWSNSLLFFFSHKNRVFDVKK